MIHKWLKDYNEKDIVVTRVSGNYTNDETKEMTRLKEKLRETQNALDI